VRTKRRDWRFAGDRGARRAGLHGLARSVYDEEHEIGDEFVGG